MTERSSCVGPCGYDKRHNGKYDHAVLLYPVPQAGGHVSVYWKAEPYRYAGSSEPSDGLWLCARHSNDPVFLAQHRLNRLRNLVTLEGME